MTTTLLWTLFGSPAHALPIATRLCVEYQTDFADASLGLPSAREDDFFTDNQNRPAWGARIQAIPRDPPQGVTTLERNVAWEQVGNLDPGCVDVELDSGAAWDFKVFSEAVIDDVDVEVRRAEGTAVWVGSLVPRAPTSFDPAVGYEPWQVSVLSLQTASVHRAWNVSAAMGWAVKRRRYGFSGLAVKAFTDDASPCGAQDSCQSGAAIWFDETGTDIERRYLIVHALGHLLGWQLDEQTDPHVDTNASAGDCPNYPAGGNAGSQMASREHASRAAVEGFADYYAAIAFNDRAESDCSFVYWKDQDFTRNQAADYDHQNDAMSCEGSPIWDASQVDAKDYLADFCGTALEDRGTELDWLRFFWDLDSDRGVAFSKIADLWDAAGPNDWQAVGIPNQTDSDEVLQRILGAADNPLIDILGDVQAVSDNGVDH